MTQPQPPQYLPPPPQAPDPAPPTYPPYGQYPPAGYGYGMANPYGAPPPRHSGIGIASVMLAGVSVLGLVGTMVVAVAIAANDPHVFENENAPATLAVGVCALVCLVLSLVGIGLGIGGLVQGGRKRLFPWIGLGMNAVIVLLVIGLVVIGAASN